PSRCRGARRVATTPPGTAMGGRVTERRRPTRQRFAAGRALAAGLGLLLLAASARAQELIRFDLQDLGGPFLALFGPGVVITGSDVIHSGPLGLGVAGGSPALSGNPDLHFDAGEFMWFVFTNPLGAFEVRIAFLTWSNGGDMLLDAFGPDG